MSQGDGTTQSCPDVEAIFVGHWCEEDLDRGIGTSVVVFTDKTTPEATSASTVKIQRRPLEYRAPVLGRRPRHLARI